MVSLSARLWGNVSFMWCTQVRLCVCRCFCFLTYRHNAVRYQRTWGPHVYVEVCKVEVEAPRFNPLHWALWSLTGQQRVQTCPVRCHWKGPQSHLLLLPVPATDSNYLARQRPFSSPRLTPAPTHRAAEHASLHGVVYTCICISVQLVAHVLFTHRMLVKNTVSQSRLSVEMSSNGFQTTLFL